MATKTSNFKGHKYSIDDQDQLTINGEVVEIVKTDDGRYFTPNLPYQHYKSLRDLAKQLIDNSPNYKTF